jgi:hypothetical protein
VKSNGTPGIDFRDFAHQKSGNIEIHGLLGLKKARRSFPNIPSVAEQGHGPRFEIDPDGPARHLRSAASLRHIRCQNGAETQFETALLSLRPIVLHHT